jgi:ATP-binding cassette, subfamily B, multidrug efflux pump
MTNRTTFVIAQRLDSVRAADQVLVLDQGRIVDRGTHDELIRREGVYRRIYEIQARTRQTQAIPDAP